MRSVLRWVERALLTTGVALAVWCSFNIGELYYYNSLPIPPSTARAEASSGRAWVSKGREWVAKRLEWVAKDVAPPDEAAVANPSRRYATVRPGMWLARLEAPAIGFSASVLEGADDSTLQRAAGHVEYTAFPGSAGNMVIAGHRDTVFRPVRNLRIGDTLVLTTSDYVYRYRITSTKIIDPSETDVLDPTPHPTLTLVTCYPFTFIGHAPNRFIVRADLDAEEARAAPAHDD